MNKTDVTSIAGFKATANGHCRNVKIKVGDHLKMKQSAIACRRGFHYCQALSNIFWYYYPSNGHGAIRIYRVADLNPASMEGAKPHEVLEKRCTNSLKIGSRMTAKEIMDQVRAEKTSTYKDISLIDRANGSVVLHNTKGPALIRRSSIQHTTTLVYAINGKVYTDVSMKESDAVFAKKDYSNYIPQVKPNLFYYWQINALNSFIHAAARYDEKLAEKSKELTKKKKTATMAKETKVSNKQENKNMSKKSETRYAVVTRTTGTVRKNAETRELARQWKRNQKNPENLAILDRQVSAYIS